MAPKWPKNESPTGRGITQGSDSYRADDVARMEREDERRLAERRLKALQNIRDITTDCGVDRLLEIRMIVDEALGEPRVQENDMARIEAVREMLSDTAPTWDDPNFGDYNIPPGGNHP